MSPPFAGDRMISPWSFDDNLALLVFSQGVSKRVAGFFSLCFHSLPFFFTFSFVQTLFPLCFLDWVAFACIVVVRFCFLSL